jgi:hypothetical protein
MIVLPFFAFRTQTEDLEPGTFSISCVQQWTEQGVQKEYILGMEDSLQSPWLHIFVTTKTLDSSSIRGSLLLWQLFIWTLCMYVRAQFVSLKNSPLDPNSFLCHSTGKLAPSFPWQTFRGFKTEIISLLTIHFSLSKEVEFVIFLLVWWSKFV